MHGYGSHTFSLINAEGQRHWVKFHHRTQQGIRNLTDAEATAVRGRGSRQQPARPARGDRPRRVPALEALRAGDAGGRRGDGCRINPFNLTKVWPKGDYPLIEVGQWELNRNPENYFAEVEQAAFAPSRVVPGIGFSPDKMLQGRLFSYPDAQYYRLGVNHQMIPVNAPRCPVHSYHRDGAMRVDGNYGATLHYEPNSYGQWQEQPAYRTPPEPLGDVAAYDWNFREDDDDYYTQPRNLFALLDTEQRQALFDNTARAMYGAPDEIQQRWVGLCAKADPAYGAGVAKAIVELGAKLTPWTS